jgi:hypothetical protein
MNRLQCILITVSLLAGILLNAGCDLTDRYDVRGTWTFSGEYIDVYFDKTLTFGGEKATGTVTDELSGTATYVFDGYSVNFDLSIICFCKKTWIGHFIDKDHMEGTLNGCSSGSWTASRI